MQLTLPQSDQHSGVQLLVVTPKGPFEIAADSTHKTFDVELPRGVNEEDVEVTARFLTSQNRVDEAVQPIVLKAKTVRKAEPKPAPKAEPKPEYKAPKADPKPEYKPADKAEADSPESE